MIIKLAEELNYRPPGSSDVVNVGGGVPSSLNNMIGVLEGISGKKLNKSYEINDVKDSNKTDADTSLQKELTGIFPETKLAVGLREFWKWLQH